MVVTAPAACGRPSRFDRAIGVLGKADAFTTGRQAGVSMAEVAALVRDDLAACLRDHGRDDARCLARAAAFGYMQVAAVRVLPCTAPGRLDGRLAARRYLTAVQRVRRGDELPRPPVPPRC
jgi:hypothetical protein